MEEEGISFVKTTGARFWKVKISNLMIAELFYSRILNMNRGSLLQEVSDGYISPFLDTHELKNG